MNNKFKKQTKHKRNVREIKTTNNVQLKTILQGKSF